VEECYTSKASDIKLFPGHRAVKSILQQCPGNNLMPLAHSFYFADRKCRGISEYIKNVFVKIFLNVVEIFFYM
jgi:hypothetical protein